MTLHFFTRGAGVPDESTRIGPSLRQAELTLPPDQESRRGDTYTGASEAESSKVVGMRSDATRHECDRTVTREPQTGEALLVKNSPRARLIRAILCNGGGFGGARECFALRAASMTQCMVSAATRRRYGLREGVVSERLRG
jgi:hypothetical protein